MKPSVAILESVAATDTTRLDAEYLTLTDGCGLVDRSERGKLALTGPGAKEFLAGQVTNDTEALTPGSGCYAAFLTPKGKMLGDLRVLRPRRGAAARHRARGAAGPVRHDPPLQDRLRRATAQAHHRVRAALADRARRAARVAGRRDEAAASRSEALTPDAARDARDRGRCGRFSPAPISGSTSSATPPTASTVREALLSAGATAGERGGRGDRPRRARPAALRSRPRRDRHPPGGRPERARGELHEGLLRRPGDGRAPLLQGQAQPSPARPAPDRVRAEPGAELRLGERSVGRLTSAVLSPAHGPIGLALVRREAEPGASVSVGEHGVEAEVVELPFAAR